MYSDVVPSNFYLNIFSILEIKEFNSATFIKTSMAKKGSSSLGIQIRKTLAKEVVDDSADEDKSIISISDQEDIDQSFINESSYSISSQKLIGSSKKSTPKAIATPAPSHPTPASSLNPLPKSSSISKLPKGKSSLNPPPKSLSISSLQKVMEEPKVDQDDGIASIIRESISSSPLSRSPTPTNASEELMNSFSKFLKSHNQQIRKDREEMVTSLDTLRTEFIDNVSNIMKDYECEWDTAQSKILRETGTSIDGVLKIICDYKNEVSGRFEGLKEQFEGKVEEGKINLENVVKSVDKKIESLSGIVAAAEVQGRNDIAKIEQTQDLLVFWINLGYSKHCIDEQNVSY